MAQNSNEQVVVVGRYKVQISESGVRVFDLEKKCVGGRRPALILVYAMLEGSTPSDEPGIIVWADDALRNDILVDRRYIKKMNLRELSLSLNARERIDAAIAASPDSKMEEHGGYPLPPDISQ